VTRAPLTCLFFFILVVLSEACSWLYIFYIFHFAVVFALFFVECRQRGEGDVGNTPASLNLGVRWIGADEGTSSRASKGTETEQGGAQQGQKGGEKRKEMEDGWVLIEQRDELDAVETAASSNCAPSPTTPSQFEHIYPSHLSISTQWLEIAAYSRGWMYIQWQECERYARHIAHFFPSDEVVERRRAAVADERRRAFEETQELVEIELKRQSDVAARHKREGESRNQWVAAILQRWAAADARKRREEQGGEEEEEEGQAAGGVDGGAADGQHSKTETPVSTTAAVKVGEPKDVVAEVEEEAKKEKKREEEEDQQGGDKERKRLKEEGRTRFSEWKKKNESDGGGGGGNVAAAAGVADGGAPVPVPERRSLGQSAERELEEWELIEAQDGRAATANATTKAEAEAPPVQQEHEEDARKEEEKEEEVEAVSENVAAAAAAEEERRLRDRTEACLRERVKDKAGERSDVRFIPFAYPLRKVVAGFDHWRRSLWCVSSSFVRPV
jgi:hypothetical protein